MRKPTQTGGGVSLVYMSLLWGAKASSVLNAPAHFLDSCSGGSIVRYFEGAWALPTHATCRKGNQKGKRTRPALLER